RRAVAPARLGRRLLGLGGGPPRLAAGTLGAAARARAGLGRRPLGQRRGRVGPPARLLGGRARARRTGSAAARGVYAPRRGDDRHAAPAAPARDDAAAALAATLLGRRRL